MISENEILQLLEQAEARIQQLEAGQSRDIAVIGLGCKFPDGIETPGDYWNYLIDNRCAIQQVSEYRRGFSQTNIQHAAMINQIDQFDPGFFNLSKHEADSMDPQQRLLLEVTWHALEDALIPASNLNDSNTGIFIGLSWHDYETLTRDITPSSHLVLGNMQSIAAGRLAYFFGTNGPAMSIDTSCSSSLVAIHQAVNSLRLGETSLAIAGGASLIMSDQSTSACDALNALSTTGTSHVFSDKANGYVRGEGAGIVILKRLQDAIRDGDSVQAVIRGSAVNHDGQSSGLTVPNRQAQQQLMQLALHDAKLSVTDVDYIEAHGTGTKLGDPIELGAISDVFSQQSKSIYVGSVKANLGHSEASAGVVSFIKSVLMLQHKTIPAQINSEILNTQFDWSTSTIEIPQQNLTHEKATFIAGVNSFGMSGTNAHLLLSNYQQQFTTFDDIPNLFVLSAKNQIDLERLVNAYLDWLTDTEQVSLTDLCYSLQVGRSHFKYRLAFVVDSILDVCQQLRNYLQGLSEINSSNEHLLRMQKTYLTGVNPDWQNLYNNRMPNKIKLKPYVFNHQRCWYDQLLISKMLMDHQINGRVICPGTYYLYLLQQHLSLPDLTLNDVKYTYPLYLDDLKTPQLKVMVKANKLEVIADNDSKLTHVCEAGFESGIDFIETVAIQELINTSGESIAVQHFYQQAKQLGYHYQGEFQAIKSLQRINAHSILAKINVVKHFNTAIYPASLDACFQPSILLLGVDSAYIPTGISTFKLLQHQTEYLWSYVCLENEMISVNIYTDNLTLVCQATDLKFRRLNHVQKVRRVSHKEILLQFVATLTGFTKDDIDTSTNFWDLGFDSLMWLELKEQLEEYYATELDDTVIFDHPNVTQLSMYLQQLTNEVCHA